MMPRCADLQLPEGGEELCTLTVDALEAGGIGHTPFDAGEEQVRGERLAAAALE